MIDAYATAHELFLTLVVRTVGLVLQTNGLRRH